MVESGNIQTQARHNGGTQELRYRVDEDGRRYTVDPPEGYTEAEAIAAGFPVRWVYEEDKPDAREVSLLIKVRLRDGTENERHADVAPDMIPALQKALSADINIREARIYREVFCTHKSYAEDFDPARLTGYMDKWLANPAFKAALHRHDGTRHAGVTGGRDPASGLGEAPLGAE